MPRLTWDFATGRAANEGDGGDSEEGKERGTKEGRDRQRQRRRPTGELDVLNRGCILTFGAQRGSIPPKKGKSYKSPKLLQMKVSFDAAVKLGGYGSSVGGVVRVWKFVTQFGRQSSFVSTTNFPFLTQRFTSWCSSLLQ